MVTSRGVAALAVASGCCWWLLAAVGPLTERVPTFLAVYAVTFVLYGVACWRSGFGARLQNGSLAWMLGAALCFRAIAWWAPVSLSDDIYRYVWDGVVMDSGVNPYRYAPADPALAPLRADWHAAINHPSVPTIYPPGVQLVFWAVARRSPTVGAMKLAATLADCLVVGLVAGWLRARRLPLGRVLVYAWSPLAILEFAGSGHADVFAIACLVAASWALDRGRRWSALVALAASVLGKLVPAVVFPLFLVRAGWRPCLMATASVILAYALFATGGVDPWLGARTFAAHWQGNAVAFPLLEALAGSRQAAMALVAAVVLAVLAWLVRQRVDLPVAAATVLGMSILLSPVLHPWYATWWLPFLCFSPQLFLWGLTGTVVLAYSAWMELARTGVYAVDWPTRVAELAVPLCLWGAVLVIQRKRPPWTSDNPPM